MGSKPMKVKGFSQDIKMNKNIGMLRLKIKELNSLTMDEKFRSKTGYLVYFGYNESSIDKILNLLSTEPMIRADVVSKK